MTKPLDPEIKSIRAINRALFRLPSSTQKRVLEWAVNWGMETYGYRLPAFPPDVIVARVQKGRVIRVRKPKEDSA